MRRLVWRSLEQVRGQQAHRCYQRRESSPEAEMKKVVLASVGSLGDLHPFIAVGLALKRRGLDAVLAVPQSYVAKVERSGLKAHAIFPDFETLGVTQEIGTAAAAKRLMRDPDFLVRSVFLDHLSDTATKLEEAARGAAAIVSTSFAPGEMVAEKLALPIIPAVLQPYMMFSASEPPVSLEFWMLRSWPKTRWGVAFNRLALQMIYGEMRRRYGGSINCVRRANGLGPATTVPILGLPPAPLTLALYSPVLGAPMLDHPPNTLVTGAVFFDSESGAPETLDEEALAFRSKGEPPLVFSLGSFVVNAPGNFYRESLAAARLLGRRAVLLTGGGEAPPPADDVLIRTYVPHSQIFPLAAAIIHHGGAGTTAQALLAGKPQIVVPHMGDQWDHGARIQRLGVGKFVRPDQYRAARVANALKELFAEPAVAQRAQQIGIQISAERGAETAAEAIERTIG